MSRVGKLPVELPKDVKVEFESGEIVIKGKLGELRAGIPDVVEVKEHKEESSDNVSVRVSPVDESRRARAMWGTIRSIIHNMVVGVSEGFSVRLEINGVGYKAAVKGDLLVLYLGYSHEIIYAIPAGITIKCEKPTLIVVSGFDKQKVGQIVGEIMKLRKVEPYKGKGIYKEGSYVRRKEGKKK